MPSTRLADATGITAASPACGSGSHWWLLSLLSVAVFVVGWGALWRIAHHYPPATGLRRWSGQAFQVVSAMTAAGTWVARQFGRTDGCGRVRGAAGGVEAWLFLVTVVLFMLGVIVAAHGTEWVATAAIAVADIGLVPVFLGRHQAYQAAILVVLLVHGGCSTVAAWWARRVRAGGPAARAKAAEPGRILAGGWLVLLLLGIAATGEPIGAVLPDSTLLGLFVVAAISTVTGAGYTKYVEAREDLTSPPAPDALDRWAAAVRRAVGRPSHWLRTRRQRCKRAQPDAAAGPLPATTPTPGRDPAARRPAS